MKEPYSPTQRAEGRIKLIAARLAGRYPFHARVLEQFSVRVMPGLETMGVTVVGRDILLLHNPEFTLQTPADELVGVLLHEVHHVVLGHVLADPKDFPDEWARTVAEEVTVNEFVREPLPEGAIKLELFPALPPLESTAQRYERLKKVRNRFPISRPTLLPDGPAGAAEGDVPLADGRPGATSNPQAGTRCTVDDHIVWGQSRQDLQAARDAVRDALQQAVLEVGAAGLPDALRTALQGVGVGTEPGQEEHWLQADRQCFLDWRTLLRRYVGQVLEPRPALTRPPRRFPELAGVLPALSRRPLRPRVMAVIDTSGSISEDLLELISGELRRLAAGRDVTVVECDAAIHKVGKYRRLGSVIGRGGMDLRPALERDFLRRHRPDLVIYFTDGFGPARDCAPCVPVIWCLTPQGRRPAPWGRVIRLDR